MNDISDKLEDLAATLKTERDQLRLQLHLLKAEAKDEWDEAEEKWHRLEPRLQKLKKGLTESGEDIGAATGQLAEEIAHAYRRLRDSVR